MSIASELNNLEGNIGDAYDAVNDMSGIIPQHKNMANLDQAIRTIPQSQGATYTAGNGINIDANNEISVDTSVVATQTDLAGKQDTLTAGSNMTISNNVISAKVDSALSASSTNPVQNSVVKAALDGFISEDDLYSEVCGSGTTITFQDAPDNAPLSDFKLKGETSQNGTPTPDAPVAVQTVTGENVVKVRGKNLLELPSAGTADGVTYSINSDGTFNIHGTNNSGHEILFSYYLDSGEFQSVDYTLGAREALPYGLSCRCEIYKGVTWKRSFVSVSSTRQTKTGTPDFTDANRIRVAISIANGATVNIDNVGIQLELGSSASSFEPYQEQSYEVNLGKNLAKMANGAYSYSEADQTFTLLDGSITTTRTNGSYQGGAINISTGALNRWSKFCASDSHLTGSGGTYTLTFSRTGDVVVSSSSPRACIYGFIYDNDGNNTSGNGQLLVDLSRQTSGTYTLNLDADRHLGALVFYSQYISYSDVEFKVQLEKGSQATSYAPYKTPIELCKIGDYQDYIYKSGDKWYVRKEIGEIPSYAGETISTDYVSTTGSLTTGATIYYVLAAPTDTEITNEALVAQLEAILSQGHTYAGTNNITTVIAAGNAQGELEICYTKTLLPIATETNLGLVQIGSGLSITPNGVLSATGGGAAQNEPIVVWLDWDSVGTDLEILGTATGQFMDNYTSSATAVGSSFFAGAVSDNKQVIIRTGGGLPAPGRDWATETVRPVQVNYNGLGSATMYFWHETMFVRAQCPNSGTTWTFTKLSV